MKSKDKPKKEKKKDKKIILWEVNSFPAIKIKKIKTDKRLNKSSFKGIKNKEFGK